MPLVRQDVSTKAVFPPDLFENGTFLAEPLNVEARVQLAEFVDLDRECRPNVPVGRNQSPGLTLWPVTQDQMKALRQDNADNFRFYEASSAGSPRLITNFSFLD